MNQGRVTVGTALQSATGTLTGVSDAPTVDACRLLLSVLRREESSWLYAHSEEELSNEQRHALEELIRERAAGKPLAYILGEWEFYGRPFYVTEDVLVPRPSTEELVEQALQYIDVLMQKQRHVTVADIGTGSGIIAITLLREALRKGRRLAKVYATDISPAALEVAKKNAQWHGIAERVEFLEGNMLAPLKGRPLDLIVSNPPYVASAELESRFAKAPRDKVETIGLNFEPRIALDGGNDGQNFVRQIQQAGVPALVESTNGEVHRFNY